MTELQLLNVSKIGIRTLTDPDLPLQPLPKHLLTNWWPTNRATMRSPRKTPLPETYMMNIRKPMLLTLLPVLALAFNSPALADSKHRHHHHSHSGASVGFYFGAPWGPWVAPPPYYYPAPVYYPPRVIVLPPPQPPVYIEQSPPDTGNYWYYCQQSGAYYPQVQQCPAGWIRVPPR